MMEKRNIEAMMEEKLNSEQRVLTEDEAKALFAGYGIPVVEELWAESVEGAGEAAAKTGFPVVLKGMGATLLHKTEANLVRLNLGSVDQVRAAATEMKDGAGDALEGFLVQPMVSGRRELVAGMFRDVQFGPVIVFGLGGIFTEALKDVVFRVAPLSEADMDEMLEEFQSKAVLGNFRGEAAADRKALKAVLRGLSDLVAAYPRIKEVDINPVMLTPEGEAVAVDGLVILDDAPVETEVQPPVNLRQLGQCFYPKSIAFVGASSSVGKWGHLLACNALCKDFAGDIYLVNPKGGEILGHQAYKQVADIPGTVDMAVVTIPAHRVMDLIPQLEEKKVKGMFLITSGFREVGEAGAALEKELVARMEKAGILLLGPNTMGMCNPHADLFFNASHAYPVPGSTALVCQSGNMGTQLLAFAEQQDIGIRAFSGSGNEAMVTIEDYLDAFADDELTRTVVLYIESVKNGRRFFEGAREVSRKKPVVVLKGGRTDMGVKAAASHTGAMASDAKVFDSACRQAGIIQVEQPMELLDLSAVFSSLPLPRGSRVAIMTLGGGWGVITTDLCAEYGLEVPQLSEDIIERLNGILPDFWSHGNPVDLVGEGDPSIPRTCLEELLKWDGCDAVIHLGIHGKRILVDNMIRSAQTTDPGFTDDQSDFVKSATLQGEDEYVDYVIELTEKYQKPVLGVSLLTDALSRTLYRREGAEHKGVFFPAPERAVKALAGMCRYQKWLAVHGE